MRLTQLTFMSSYSGSMFVCSIHHEVKLDLLSSHTVSGLYATYEWYIVVLEYCNVLYIGLSLKTIQKLQLVLSAAAWTVLGLLGWPM